MLAPKDGYRFCPRCQRTFQDAMLPAHLQTHLEEDAELALESGPDGPRQSPIFASRERLIDATKNAGYPSRERGAYGSSPSHDGSGEAFEHPEHE